MVRVSAALLLMLVLAGCAGYTATPDTTSACVTQGEASYACQIERYFHASA